MLRLADVAWHDRDYADQEAIDFLISFARTAFELQENPNNLSLKEVWKSLVKQARDDNFFERPMRRLTTMSELLWELANNGKVLKQVDGVWVPFKLNETDLNIDILNEKYGVEQ